MLNHTAVFLLCRKKNNNLYNLHKILLQNNIKTFIIEDEEPGDSFHGLSHIKLIDKKNNRYKSTAWDNAFYFIFKNLNLELNNIKYFYFIEDDVYSKNLTTFVDLINFYENTTSDFISGEILPKKESEKWSWWKNDDDFLVFYEPYRSFNPICRMSIRLIKLIHDHHKKWNRFFYNEFLFASISKQNKLTCLDYNREKNPFIGKIIYRPCLDKSQIKDNKIYHPVKEQ